jgi:hypothetical protein
VLLSLGLTFNLPQATETFAPQHLLFISVTSSVAVIAVDMCINTATIEAMCYPFRNLALAHRFAINIQMTTRFGLFLDRILTHFQLVTQPLQINSSIPQTMVISSIQHHLSVFSHEFDLFFDFFIAHKNSIRFILLQLRQRWW